MKRIGKSIFGVRHGFVLGLLFTVLLALPGISVAQQPVLVTNPVRLELTEGGTGTFTVKLDKAPSADTELRIDGDNSGDLSQHSVDPNRYTFTTTNWETEKTITVNVGHDDNADDDKKTGSDSGAWIIRFVVLDVNANNSGVTVLVTDDDEAGNIVLTPATGTLDVNEGSSATFEVHLDTLPLSTQTLSVAKTKAGLTVSPTTLTFLTTNYSTKQMVTVTGSQDNDHQDIEDTITLSVSSGDSKKYIADDVTKAVEIDDDDTGGITVPSAAIVISESRTQRTGMNVKLNSAPLTGTIASINVASSDTGAATLSTNSLRFTTSTWNVNNSVGITPVNDADGTDETVTITLTPSSGYPDVDAVTKEVTIQDDDGGINISSGAVNVIEGEDGTFTVTLAAPPKQSATFSVTSGDTAVATVSPPTLIFNTSNKLYDTAQTVTVTGVHDADQSNETATITVAATGGYRASNATKSISVTDDDARLDVSSAAVSFAEDSTGTFTVGLTSVPSTNVTVTVSSGDTSKATVSPSPITFTSTDWDAETVTVTGVDDNDGTDDTVTISLDASGTTPDATKDVTIEDDDGEIEVSAAAVEITEGGSAGTFEVTLAHPPKTSVTLNVTSGDSGAATVSPATLTFNTSGKPYDTAQTVTVTPADDSDGLDESVSITLAVSSAGGYRAADATKTISVEDDDRSIELSSAAVDLTEGGSTGSFTVELETAPAAGDDATITVSSGDTAAATVSPATLTFTSTDYNTAQTVTVTPVQDTDGLDESVTITVSSDSNYEADAVTKDISVVDDDRSIIATAASALTEGSGSTSTFDVTLETAPASGVDAELSVTSGDTAAVTVDPATLTFTSSNYDTVQQVTLTPVDDDDAWDETVTITLSETAGYDADDETVSVTVNDDDTAALMLDDATGLIVEEDDTTGVSFKVRLDTRPSEAVTVTVTTDNADVVIDTDSSTSGAQTTLTFNPTGQTKAWDDYQTVKLTVSHDNDTDGESATITVTGDGGDYDDLTASLLLTITDDDIPPGNIEIAPTGTLSVGEGGSKYLAITLSAEPVFDVKVDLAKTHAGVTLSPSSLTFTVSDYEKAQNVSVSAAHDDDAIDESDTITLSATGGLIAGNETVAVTVVDDEEAVFDLNTETLTLIEGKQTYFLVRLASRPSHDVTATITPTAPITIDTDPTQARDQNTLIFGQTDQPNAWNRYKRVAVVANRDEDEDDETFTIALSAKGGDYEGKTASVSVSVADVPPGDIVLLPEGMVSIREGGSRRQIEVSLSNAPNSDVVVSLSNTNPDVRLDKDSLTFTPSNYSQAQRFTIHSEEDGDGMDDSDTIILSASGGLFALPMTMEVMIVDDDAPPPPPPPPSSYQGGVTITPSGPYEIPEGGKISLTVSLDAEPDEPVPLTLSKGNPELSIVPSLITFTSSNWNELIGVDIVAGEDHRAVDASETIVFSIPGRTLESLDITIKNNDAAVVAHPARGVEITEGQSGLFHLELDRLPPAAVEVSLSTRNDFIDIAPTSLTFTPSNWNSRKEVRVRAKQDLDAFDDYDSVIIDAGGGSVHHSTVTVSIMDDDDDAAQVVVPEWEVKSKALAIPPTSAQDSATVRVRCDQATPCKIFLDCSTQNGVVLQGYLPAIPAGATSTLVPGYIQRQIGSKGSWEGRLGCSLRSEDNIGSQVWTRSGDGVLVNNSAVIRSERDGDIHRADIESIPSPDAFDLSNIRIRCDSQSGPCANTVFVCYTDAGQRFDADLGIIAQGITRHMQADELANLMGYRWPDLGLSCEVRSSGRFTAQILTRTGGGGALVNNSATGAAR